MYNLLQFPVIILLQHLLQNSKLHMVAKGLWSITSLGPRVGMYGRLQTIASVVTNFTDAVYCKEILQ